MASCLDEELTFSEDFFGRPKRGDKAGVVLEADSLPSLVAASLLLSMTHLMSMDFMRSFSAFEL